MNPGVTEMVGCLKHRRKWLKITRREVADACSVPEFVIRQVEAGEIDPTVTLLLDYADAVNMSLVWKLSAFGIT